MNDKQLARLRQYEKRLNSLLPQKSITVTFGGDVRNALKVLIEANPGQGDHYVYLHRGINDEVFYVDKGQGDRAYTKDRDEMWLHYLKTKCNGEYAVEIVKRFETDEQALKCESDLIALFGEQTVNRINCGRQLDYKAHALFHSLRKANWMRIAAATKLEKDDPGRSEQAYREAILQMADYARIILELVYLLS